MINKNTIKLIKSLASKKNRIKERLFLAEGDKNVSEVLHSNLTVEKLYATNTFLKTHQTVISKAVYALEVSQNEIERISLLKNPQNSLALCTLPPDATLPARLNKLHMYLDGIQDPGNLGTIIRICDWYGMHYLFCSHDTADAFNPKVIQSSMGSFCRVQVCKTDFSNVTEIAKKSNVTIYGTYLEGENMYKEMFSQNALIVLGNEGIGIRKELENSIHKKISIPSFSEKSDRAESLNVSVATAIICSEFMRQQHPDYSK